MIENGYWTPDLDYYVKEFLNIGYNENRAIQLKPYMLNPFLKILETMDRYCFIEMEKVSSTELKNNEILPSYKEGKRYLVYPKLNSERNKGTTDKILGITYIDNPLKIGK